MNEVKKEAMLETIKVLMATGLGSVGAALLVLYVDVDVLINGVMIVVLLLVIAAIYAIQLNQAEYRKMLKDIANKEQRQ